MNIVSGEASFVSWRESASKERGDLVLTNARIVSGGETFLGTLRLHDGVIADVAQGRTHISSALDLDGDYLLPGLVDVHTDHLEKQALPRAGMFWNALNAAATHDVIVCAAGITTVFDSLVVGAVGNPERRALLSHMVQGLDEARGLGLMRVDHLLHLRCDAREEGLFDLMAPHLDHPQLRFVTVMDDSPARDMDRYWRLERHRKISDEEIERRVVAAAEAPDHATVNRRRLVDVCRERALPLASHDDTQAAHIAEAAAFGLTIAEFPISMEAARAARAAGMDIIIGSPNMVAGRSHIGNVSARDLAAERLIDVVCSDYIPASLLHALWLLQSDPFGFSLPRAIALGSRRPAELFGLGDRGEIAPDRRADLIRVREYKGAPVVRNVWVEGRPVL